MNNRRLSALAVVHLVNDVMHRPEGLGKEQACVEGTFGTFCVR
jgi:hypothetical protein